MTDVTRILNAIEQGRAAAADELLPLVYEQLRLLAAQKLSQERPGQTLQATALVHEAYIRLLDEPQQNWHGRGHFSKAAAQAMRRILVESRRHVPSRLSQRVFRGLVQSFDFLSHQGDGSSRGLFSAASIWSHDGACQRWRFPSQLQAACHRRGSAAGKWGRRSGPTPPAGGARHRTTRGPCHAGCR